MNRERRDRLLESLFQVRPTELPLTALLFVYCLCAVGAFIVGRSARDALFLSRADRALLPWMYVFSALAVALVGSLYSRIADHYRRDRLTAATAGAFALTFVLLRALSYNRSVWAPSLLYVWVEVMGALVILQFWTLASDMFHARDAKRLFGTIGAGGVLSNILIGFAVSGFAQKLGAENLLLLCAGLLFACALLARAVGRRALGRVARPRTPAASGRRSGTSSKLLGTGHLKAVALLSAVTFAATTLVDFQFKVVSASSFGRDELAVFFGRFYAFCGVAALLVQVFGTGRLLARYGVIVALSVLPLFLGLGSAALLAWPMLWAVVLTKGAENVFRYTVNDATTQLLYLPVSAEIRGKSKAFIDGVVKPGAIAATGLLLIGYRTLAHSLGAAHAPDTFTGPVAAASLLFCLVWGAMLATLRVKYMRSLQETLRRRALDLATAHHQFTDEATGKVLSRALQSADASEVLGALELLPHVPSLDLGAELEKLLARPSPQVRLAALSQLSQRTSVRSARAVLRLFADPDPGVRAAAIEAFCAMAKERAVRSVSRFLQDPSPPIRAAAIAGMIRYGGLDGVLSAAGELKGLIKDPDPEMRGHAARVLGKIGVRNFYQPLLELMVDRELEVRRAAIAAAGALKAPELLTSLIYRLSREETARDAIEALAAYGAGIEPLLAKVLDNPSEDPSVRRNAPRVLGRIVSPRAVEVLSKHLFEPDELLRWRIYRALAHCLKQRHELTLDKRAIQRAIEMELAQAYRALWIQREIAPGGAFDSATPRSGVLAAQALLCSALKEKVDRAEARAFALIGLLHRDAEVELIYAGYKEARATDAARQRANAVELLDNLLDRSLKAKLLPLVEDTPLDVRLRAVEGLFPRPEGGRAALMRELLKDENAWVRACAAHYAGQLGSSELCPQLAESLQHPWDVVREASLVALSRLAPPSEFLPALRQRSTDESALVRELARSLLSAEEIRKVAQ